MCREAQVTMMNSHEGCEEMSLTKGNKGTKRKRVARAAGKSHSRLELGAGNWDRELWQGTGGSKLGTGNLGRELGTGELGTGNWGQGPGDGELGAGNRNREIGREVKDLGRELGGGALLCFKKPEALLCVVERECCCWRR